MGFWTGRPYRDVPVAAVPKPVAPVTDDRAVCIVASSNVVVDMTVAPNGGCSPKGEREVRGTMS